ncbi:MULTISPECIES: hypothetical protein [Providencia]|uniref:Uncharacterized protein n=1 Tax=Providencia huaxiensis TaxID=2027290 RepID=A0ABU2IXW5_9GAMM|nr:MULTISPECIES: hypothetical protein [Providencia]MBZ3680409.1 hypothetical protein [Providencia rettgeri]MDT0133908.1 hypothetical protein [Providencia huaxiensis]MDT1980314.1 hypothetical protein [Providencia huaxiensis]
MLIFNKKTDLIYLSLLLFFSLPSVLSAQELKGGVIGNLKDYSNEKLQSEINNVKYSEKISTNLVLFFMISFRKKISIK